MGSPPGTFLMVRCDLFDIWLQTTGRRESLGRPLPHEILLAKGDFYLLLSHRLVKAAAKQSSHNLVIAVQVQVSRGIYFFATSPCEAGSCFPPGSCCTHQFSRNRPNTTVVGWGLLERGTLTPWSQAPDKLTLHHCFHFYCRKRTARLRHDLCHTVLSHCSLCRNVAGNTKSLLHS